MPTTPVAPTAPAEDTPPWQEPPAPTHLLNPEAAWVAWGNFLVVVPGFDYETDEEYEQYIPMSVTIRDGVPVSDIFTNVNEFLKSALALGWKPLTDGKQSVFDISKPPVAAQQQASAPLPPATAPTKQPWTPGQTQAQVAPQSQAPAQQQTGDNAFVADTLLVAAKTSLKGEAYTEFRVKGGRYAKYGVRIWPDKLDAVLPGWSGAPVGEHPLPAHYKCTFSWDEKPAQDGTPRPKSVYAMELV